MADVMISEDSPLRRNGLKWSCEPCRKSKHGCDHDRPTCRRCLSRGIAERCVYHPAPMKGMPAPPKRKRPSKPLPTSVNPGAESPPKVSRTASILPPTPPTTATRSPSEPIRTAHIPNPADKDVGFLGSTSFNAVFTDNREHIPDSPAATHVDIATDGGSRLHKEITASWRGGHRKHSGDATFCLELLKDFPNLVKIDESWSSLERSCSTIGPWVQDCQISIKREIVDKYDLTSNDALETVTDLLNANTESPLRLPADVRFRDFMSYYTGENLRWEALGVFFTACGLSLFCLPCDAEALDYVGNSEQDKQRLMFRLLEGGDNCISLCNEVDSTDLVVWLMLENCIYATQVLGDAHYSVWRKLGDLSTAVFARGLHESREGANEPFWLNEVRRRGLANTYAMDKMLSTFVGRPPRISKRYCNIEIPLDLEYTELALEGDELAAARSKLDAAGWNTRNESPRAGWSAFIRPFVLGACIREEVLELCLGPPQDSLRERAQSLIRQSKDLYTSMPVSLQYTPELWLTSGSVPQFQAVSQWLDNIYNEFMLRRMLVRRFHDDPTELVLLAHDILEAVIEARNMRTVLQCSAGMPWMIVLYGLPAAGVLALELLQLNVRVISHAKIKQILCVFISYLKWAHVPGDGNYTLADRGRKTLQHILDKVLLTEAPAPLGSEVTAPPTKLDAGGVVDDLGVFDFSWLDASHFDQDFWGNLQAIDVGTLL